ncbi:MAG TPA: shikimate dehydrogenase [Gallionella sp.]|jgi:shikimate dehydrogenase|nr:shikimate dehydrogenase [Gallionella sp.]OGS67223.1 MAG: shikimate dehydrogenase [Gallionellales bacterium GWA2_54_124]OGT18485.1 MAG: shikimate dehydrogenase [Gallionellales bacterium RIFOXYD12_FULL_53_10]HCI52020.1 shikimate dehydrogenase [Gallionella sp.]
MTDRYAVIGNPISHSKSPLIHALFAKQTGQDISYEAIEAPLDGFAATIERLRSESYKGCNVTVPFKFEAYKCASDISERAKAAQAVNTLCFSETGIEGDNTDGAGLVRDIEQNIGTSLAGKNVLLMGAGGASYGVVLPLLNAGASLTIANRTASKAVELAAPFSGVTGGSYENLTELQFDVVVNATSAGLTDSAVPLPEGIFAPGALAYDMMYGRETPFMTFAREQGAQVADGLGMLIEQAAEAFFIWRGVRPDTRPVIAALRG